MPDWPRTHAEHRAALEKHGYIEIPEHKGIKPGARIRNRRQQYVKAIWHGTSTVVAVYEKPDSPWSRTYGMPDIEIIHQPDDAPDGECPITWAQYHSAPPERAGSWCVLPDGHEGQCRSEQSPPLTNAEINAGWDLAAALELDNPEPAP